MPRFTAAECLPPTAGGTTPVADIDLFTPDETARWLKVAKQTLAKWRSEGRGPAFVRLNGPGGRCLRQLGLGSAAYSRPIWRRSSAFTCPPTSPSSAGFELQRQRLRRIAEAELESTAKVRRGSAVPEPDAPMNGTDNSRELHGR